MSKDSEEKSSLDNPVRPVYLNLLLLTVIFVASFTLIGWIFSLPALNNIANEIKLLALTLGSGYAYLESSNKLSRSNLLLYISIIYAFGSVLAVLFQKSSPFDFLYNRGILTLIISLFSFRYILFRIGSKISFKLKKGKKSSDLITFDHFISYLLFGLIYYFFLCFCSIDFIKLSIFVIISVSAFYELVKVKYLSTSKEHIDTEKSKNTNIFSEIINADLFAWTIVIIMFYLYHYEFFNISSQTLYSFFSSIAQMFASIVGIVAAFSIFIIQQYANENEVKRSKLKNGITGFLIIYIFIIILSVVGILISNDTTPVNMSLLQSGTDMTLTRELINPIIFEFTLLMFPIALLYLYAMIVTFLNLDDRSESVYEMY